MKFSKAKQYVLTRLENELAPDLFYHCVEHTISVMNAVSRMAKTEHVTGDDLTMLKTAALYHDTGFIEKYIGHEAASVEVARETLPNFDYSRVEIDVIGEMIMATQIPQRPKNLLSEILCDADLDYLGTDTFERIGSDFYRELVAYGFIENEKEFNYLQVSFLESHKYFRKHNIYTRQPTKQRHLEKIKKIVYSYHDEEG
jgi:predicted metal-dependent HD superfamily phosphohydrolase